ncbi:MAG: type II toxin-antitoxin system VapC family toxin [Thermomicrobiales bacterium]
MPGSVVDLTRPGVPLPDPIIVDSNVVVTYLEGSYSGQIRTERAQAHAFFQTLRTTGQQAILTPTAYSEVIHADIKLAYQRARAAHRTSLITHYGRSGGFTWVDLYKLDPTILHQRANDLERLRQRLIASNLVLLSPDDLGPIPTGRRYDAELLDLVCRYGLDTSDATILMEAMRVGVFEIVSFDRDMRRAQADFDVYTWL